MTTGKGYGFSKKPAVAPAQTERRALDLSGLDNIPPIEVTPEKEQAAVAAGEALGFRGREATTPNNEPAASSRRIKQKVPQGKMLVTGPAHVLARFKDHSLSRGHGAYWETLLELLEKSRKP